MARKRERGNGDGDAPRKKKQGKIIGYRRPKKEIAPLTSDQARAFSTLFCR